MPTLTAPGNAAPVPFRVAPRAVPRIAAAVLAAVSIFAVPRSAAADDDDDPSRQHRERAIALYGEGDYRGAADEFELAYRIGKAPALLFAWAQAERLADSCAKATELYQQFLDANPPETDVEAAEQGIALCQEQLAATDGGAEGPWYGDVRAGVFTGAGAVLLLIGTGYFAATQASLSDAEGATNNGQLQDALGSARTSSTISFLTATGGAVLLTYGIMRYFDIRRARTARAATTDPDEPPASAMLIAPMIGADSAGLAVRVPF